MALMTFQKEKILKADPQSFFCGRPRSQWPLLAGKLFSVRERGGHNTSLKPTFWFGRPTQPHWPTAVLVSVRTHVSCLDEGWMLSTVLECIGTAGGAGMPALALLSLSVFLCSSSAPLPFQSQIKDKQHSFSSRSDPEVVVTHICFLGCLTWE